MRRPVIYGMREAVEEGPEYWVSGVGTRNELVWEFILRGMLCLWYSLLVDIDVGDPKDFPTARY